MYFVSQRSTGAPLDCQHTTQEMVSTQFIGDIFDYYELTTLCINFDIFHYYNDLKVFTFHIAFK